MTEQQNPPRDILIRFLVHKWKERVPEALFPRDEEGEVDSSTLSEDVEHKPSEKSEPPPPLVEDLPYVSPAVLIADLKKNRYVLTRVNGRRNKDGGLRFTMGFTHRSRKPRPHQFPEMASWVRREYVSSSDDPKDSSLDFVAPLTIRVPKKEDDERQAILVDLNHPALREPGKPVFYLRLDRDREFWILDPKDATGSEEISFQEAKLLADTLTVHARAEKAAGEAANDIFSGAYGVWKETGVYDLAEVLKKAKTSALLAAYKVYRDLVVRRLAIEYLRDNSWEARTMVLQAIGGAQKTVRDIDWAKKVQKKAPKPLRPV